ncbi:MAG: hypothetical protein AAB921_02900, partial [Patescibacteria group bacterium]
SLAFGTTTSNTWGGTQTFTNPIVVGSGTGTSTFTTNLSVTGNIIPGVSNSYSLGSEAYPWQHIFVGPGSLYVNGQKVVSTNGGDDVVISSDPNENLVLQTSGTANIELNPAGGQLQIKNTINVTAGKSITTTDLSALPVPSGVAAGNITVSGNSVSATNLNGGISLAPSGNGGVYVMSGNFGVGTTSPSQALSVNGNELIGGNSVITGTATIGSATGLVYRAAGLISTASVTSPLSFSGGTLSISTAGDWTGTLDGYEASALLAAGFSTTSADYWKTQNDFYSTTSANAWLATKSTTDLSEGSNLYYTPARVASVIAGTTTTALAEGSNLYYTDARARAALSSSATGLTYTSGTGAFSLTAGYTIPLTAS